VNSHRVLRVGSARLALFGWSRFWDSETARRRHGSLHVRPSLSTLAVRYARLPNSSGSDRSDEASLGADGGMAGRGMARDGMTCVVDRCGEWILLCCFSPFSPF